MTKIFIATPAFDGKVHTQYATSLAETLINLKENGILFEICIATTGSLLVAERNRLIQAFMKTDCTHMLCIDADLGWPGIAVTKMLLKDREMIAGVYPIRGIETGFTYRLTLDNEAKPIVEDQLLQADYVQGGFILLKRSVIEKMQQKFPELYFEPKFKCAFNKNGEDKGYCFFNTEVWEGEFWGEDYVFSRKAREAGVKIWIDPLIGFNHAGNKGMLIQSLMKKPEQKEPSCGSESPSQPSPQPSASEAISGSAQITP